MALPFTLLRPGVVASSFKAAIAGGTPTDIFTQSPGTQGFYYDPGVLSSMWQDAARTIPVTADGQPVGAMNDLSGNGHHLIQETDAKRPTYRKPGGYGKAYLDFNGTTQTLYAENATATTLPWAGSSQFDALTLVGIINAGTNRYMRTHRQWIASGNNSASANFPGSSAGWQNSFINSIGNAATRNMGAYGPTRPFALFEQIVSAAATAVGAIDGTTTTVTAAGPGVSGAVSTGRLVIGGIANNTGLVDNSSIAMNWYGSLYAGRVISGAEQALIRSWWSLKQYRMLVTANGGDNYVNTADFQLRDVAGVADTGHVSGAASTTFGAGYEFDKAFDGVNTTGAGGGISYWSSAAANINGAWLQSNRMSQAEPVELALRARHVTGAPRDFSIQKFSGGSWNTIKSFTGVTFSLDQQLIFSLL